MLERVYEEYNFKEDYLGFWNPPFAIRKGIAAALDAESIFEPDILLEKMLSSFLTARRKLDNTEFLDNLKTKFYNDLLEMIIFWEIVNGGARNCNYDFKTVANTQDSISNVVDVLTLFLSLQSIADSQKDYFSNYRSMWKQDMSWLSYICSIFYHRRLSLVTDFFHAVLFSFITKNEFYTGYIFLINAV